MTLAEILLIAIPGVPVLAGCFLLALSAFPMSDTTGRFATWTVAIAAGGSGLAAFALLLAPKLSLEVPAQPVIILHWLRDVGTVPLNAALALRADPFGLLLTVVMGLAHAAITAAMPADRDSARSLQRGRRQLALLTAAVLVVLSTNWLMFLAFWLCVTVIGTAGISIPTSATGRGRGRITPVVWQLLADIPLVLSLLLISSAVGSFGLTAMPTEPHAWLTLFPRNPAMITVIGLYALPSLLARWAPFPLGAAVDPASPASPLVAERALMQMVTCGPLGLWLLVQMLPLVHASPVLASTLLACGGMMAFYGTATSLTRPTLPGVLTFLWTGLCGFVLIACGLSTSADPSPLTGGLLLMISQVCVMAGALITVCGGQAGRPHRLGSSSGAAGGSVPRSAAATPAHDPLPWSPYGLTLVAGGLLACGLYGQNIAIDGLWELAIPASSTGDASGEVASVDPTPLFMFGFAVVSISLWGLSLFRGVLRHRREWDSVSSATSPPHNSSRAATALMLAGVLIVPLVAGLNLTPTITALFPVNPAAPTDSLQVAETNFLDRTSTAAGTLLALVGIVTGWMLYSRPSPWPERLAGRLGALTRLSRHGGYLESTLRAVMETILGVSSRLVGWLEPVATDDFSRHLRRRCGRLLDDCSRPLRNGPVQLHATGIVLAVAMLLLTLLWWRA